MTRIAARRLALILVLVGSLLVLNPRAFAQIDTGGITGTVHDATGAVIPGAQIKLTNEGTGVITPTVSTSTGTYSIRGVRPGTYTITGEAPGFETFKEGGVVIHVQSVLTVDMPLAAGKQSNQITVTTAVELDVVVDAVQAKVILPEVDAIDGEVRGVGLTGIAAGLPDGSGRDAGRQLGQRDPIPGLQRHVIDRLRIDCLTDRGVLRLQQRRL